MAYGDRAGEDGTFADKVLFYRNRAARVLPVYYVCTLLAIPLWLAGYGGADPARNLAAVVSSIVVSVIPVCTFFLFILGGPIDGPGWTICTLVVMWLLFPYSYPGIRARSNEQLTTDITNFYWLQLGLVLGLFPALLFVTGFWPAFAAATMHPLVRYPVFLMGALAGELCRRRASHSLLWPNAGLNFFPPCCCCKVEYDTALANEGPTGSPWSTRCWNVSVLFLVVTLSVSFVDAVIRYQSGDVDSTILGAWWYQAIVPFLQLEIIVALTREKQEATVTQRLLRHPVLQWLGRISMCVYLIHWVLLYYLCWLLEGKPLNWPETYDCEDGPEHDECVDDIVHFQNARKIPMWGIPVVMVSSLIAAELLYLVVEAPARRLLRSSRYRIGGEGSEFVRRGDGGAGAVTFSPVAAQEGSPSEEDRVGGDTSVPVFG